MNEKKSHIKTHSTPPFSEEKGPQVELRSQEVQEILSRPPRRLIRYGTTVVCSILAILITGSFFFHFPDMIQGDAVITTENPPAWIVAKSAGFIKELNCIDMQRVHFGDVLAVIENPAATQDVLALSEMLKTTVLQDSMILITEKISQLNLTLGDIQPAFSSFVQAHTDYLNFTQSNLIEQEKKAIRNQLTSRELYIANLRKQLENKRQEYVLVESNYQREKKLFKQQVISGYEIEKAEQTYLNMLQNIQQIETTLAQENIVTTELLTSYEKLNIQYEQDSNQVTSSLKSSIHSLKTAISDWEHKYALIATQSGSVSFNNIWKENQQVNTGDKVFAIISDYPGKLIARIQVPATGSGKIHPGQQVNIKMSGYPHLEFGFIEGITQNISLVPNNNYYLVEASIDQTLITTHKKQLKFTGELTGKADIITENRSLIERIFYPIKYFFEYSH